MKGSVLVNVQEKASLLVGGFEKYKKFAKSREHMKKYLNLKARVLKMMKNVDLKGLTEGPVPFFHSKPTDYWLLGRRILDSSRRVEIVLLGLM